MSPCRTTIQRISASTILPVMMLSLLATTRPAERHAIKLTHPDRVGDEYDHSVKRVVKNRTVVKRDQEPEQVTDEDFTVVLSGRVKVLSIEDGAATTLRYAIAKCEIASGNNTRVPVPPGKVMIVTRNPVGPITTAYDVGGEELPADTAKALQQVLSLAPRSDGIPSDEELAGVTQPRAVGETWRLSPNILTKTIQEAGLPVEEAQVSGTAKLTAVKTDRGAQLFQIDVAFNAKQLAGTSQSLPEWLHVDRGTFSTSAHYEVPVDPSAKSKAAASHVVAKMAASGKSPKGSALAIETSLEEDIRLTVDYSRQ